MKLFVKQFIQAKFSNVIRPSYGVVAKSSNITDNDIRIVLQTFSGSQPSATEIPEFSGAWLISPIDDEYVAILRQERSLKRNRTAILLI